MTYFLVHFSVDTLACVCVEGVVKKECVSAGGKRIGVDEDSTSVHKFASERYHDSLV